MKQQSTTATKGTTLNNVYKQAYYKDCKHQLVKIVKAHYLYPAYIKAWGNLFTTGNLRPELNIDFGNLLARCFGVPKEGSAISKILSENLPLTIMFDEAMEVSLSQVLNHCVDISNGDPVIKFTHQTARELIYVGALIDHITFGMEKSLFNNHRGVFELDGSTEGNNMCASLVLEVAGYILEIDDNFSEHMESIFSLSQKTNPFMPGVNEKLDEGILYTLKVINTFI